MKKVYLIAVVIALIAGFATFFFASEINKKTTIKDADMVEIVVPVADIEKNVSITEEMFAEDANQFVTKSVLADSVSADVATSSEQLIGMVTVDPLYANEAINTKRLQSIDGADVALSLKLPKGKVAYSFSAASVTSVDGYISEGDTVDVIVYEAGPNDANGKPTGTSSVKYKDLKILRVSTAKAAQSANETGTQINEYSTLTVEVTEEQALQLYKIENENTYKLVLNHRN
ncbi:MAG: Flp pilus assembly protein CpaB [Eubacterium sp.]